MQREWTLGRLAEEHLDYLRSFEPSVELDLDGLRLLCFHGTPDDYDGIVLPQRPARRIRRHRRRRARRRACAHPAAPPCRRGDLRQPGSVGCGYGSVEQDDFHFDPWASYAILERGCRSSSTACRSTSSELARSRDASGLPMADHTLSLYRQ